MCNTYHGEMRPSANNDIKPDVVKPMPKKKK